MMTLNLKMATLKKVFNSVLVSSYTLNVKASLHLTRCCPVLNQKMVNVVNVLKPIVKMVVKLAGVAPRKVEIEPGTVMNFWVPTGAAKTRRRPSVVFLHGFFLDGIFTWLFQVLGLARKYDVYVPDLLFFGDSSTDRPGRSVAFQAECVAKGLTELGVERCTVVGFSYGGVVAFKLAKMHPDLVESVVLSGSVVEFTKSKSKELLEGLGFYSWSDGLLPGTAEELRGLLAKGSYAKLFISFPSFIYRDILQAMYPFRKERAELLDELVVPDNDDHNGLAPTVFPQRTYLLWGEMDQIINLRFAHDTMQELGDRACLHLIKNAGHIAMMERPFCYNEKLKQILASQHE